MNKALLIALLLLAACASRAPKKEAVKIPPAMLPNNGMTDAKAGGFGKASKFMK